MKTHKIYTGKYLQPPMTDKQLLNLWKKAVFLRAGNKCEYPGCYKTQYLNPHHIYSRSRRSTRYDPDNGICLCSGHHTLNVDSAHKSPDFKETIIAAGVRTREFWDKLERKAKSPSKLDLNLERVFLEQFIETLQDR